MDVGIVGGGIAGLCAGYALKRRGGVQFTIYDPSPGGVYGKLSGMKYLHDTVDVRKMLEWLGISWTKRSVMGRIVPGRCGHTLDAWNRSLRTEMYLKTRRTSVGYDGTSSNEGVLDEAAISIPLPTLVDSLREAMRDHIVPRRVVDISGRAIVCDDGASLHDLIIYTLPLTIAGKLVRGFKCRGKFETMMLVSTLVQSEDGLIEYFKGNCDYWYVPADFTRIHRVSRINGDYVFEMNCRRSEASEAKEVAKSQSFFLLRGEGRVVEQSVTPGHLLPATWPPVWPPFIYPLGRFAQWDSRATADVVLERAIRLAKAI